jgi:hypothetical protein
VRLYPDVPRARARTALRDLLVLVLLGLFAWLGVQVHDAVDKLAVLGEGVRKVGENVPLVGGPVEDLGRAGEERVHRLANLLGLIVFGLPAVLVLARFLPDRVRQARALTAASRVLVEPESVERKRLIAMRAAFSLPYGQLLAYTRDPLGDLAAERYDALVQAALDDVGLRPSAARAETR